MRESIMRVIWIVLIIGVLSVSVVSAQEAIPLIPRQTTDFSLTLVSEQVPTLPAVLVRQSMSDRGLEVLKVFESFRSRAYRDTRGYSIGYGMQTWMGRRVTPRYPGRVTMARADAELRRQIILYENIVRTISTELPQEAFDAFVSIAYNLGRVNTTICRKIEQQLPITVKDFLSTAKVRQRVDWRLQGRRTREFLMALGDYEAAMSPFNTRRDVRESLASLQLRQLSMFQ